MGTHGGFIVIDGTDGSGKATQTKLLVERMRRENYPVETISFPRYGKKSCGLVEEYLSGAYGTALDVSPYQGSIFYAVDRFAASQNMKCILNAGVNLVADRYVGSNMGHQGSKIADPEERAKFFAWNDDLEHGIFGLPRPDVNVVLHVPSKVAIELMSERASKHGLARDIHEADPRHLEQAEAAYLDLASRFETFRVVECVEEGRLLGPEEIHEKIWILVKPFLTA